MRLAFALNCCDREAMSFVASTGERRTRDQGNVARSVLGRYAPFFAFLLAQLRGQVAALALNASEMARRPSPLSRD